MCFDLDSHPPIAPIAGGALDQTPADADRRRSQPVRRVPGARGRARPVPAIVILPDVRGLHPYYEELALRFAEHGIDALAIDWFGRTAGPEPRGEDFDHMPHVPRRPGPGSRPISSAAVEECAPTTANAPRRRRSSRVGFCMGGRMSFLAATLGLDLAGVIGLYGTLPGPWRNDAPAPVDDAARFAAPVLGLFGGADTAITPEAIAAVRRRADGGRRRPPAR